MFAAADVLVRRQLAGSASITVDAVANSLEYLFFPPSAVVRVNAQGVVLATRQLAGQAQVAVEIRGSYLQIGTLESAPARRIINFTAPERVVYPTFAERVVYPTFAERQVVVQEYRNAVL
jgi:hypothetical protein